MTWRFPVILVERKQAVDGLAEDTVGDEEELETEMDFEEEQEEEQPIPDDFYYEYQQLISKPITTEPTDPDLVSFQYLFEMIFCVQRCTLQDSLLPCTTGAYADVLPVLMRVYIKYCLVRVIHDILQFQLLSILGY